MVWFMVYYRLVMLYYNYLLQLLLDLLNDNCSYNYLNIAS
jgi:hypothetical protein